MQLSGSGFIEELRNYVKEGGNLLVIGAETAELFKNELGIKSLEQAECRQTFISCRGEDRSNPFQLPKLN